MKKIIPFTIALSLFWVGILSFSNEVRAQNIGSLRSTVTSGFSFKMDLQQGDTDSDVKELQKVLNADVDTMVALEGTGSLGHESTYFGSATKAAMVKFQEKYRDTILTPNGLTSGTGYVGKATRTKLNLLIGVMTTSVSVGSPQSRAGSGSTVSTTGTTYTAPTVITANTSSSMSTCSFVELLINIGAITSSKASTARSVLGCSSTASASSYVDLKVNSKDGPITVSKNSTVTLSWTTSGVTSCSSGSSNKSLSGSQSVTMGTTNDKFTLICKTSSGTSVSDSVTVKVSGTTSTSDESSPILETSTYNFGSDQAVFKINTNVDTKAYITYRTNSSDAETVSFTTLESSRTETITGLTPDTTYYITIKIKDADGNSYTTSEFNGKTTASSTTASSVADSTSSVIKTLYVYVNGQTSYSTTVDSSSYSYIYPAISWTSSGYSACKITSRPMVSSAYETSVATNGSLSVSIYPLLYQGYTTFTLACAAGTATTTLSQNAVSTLTSSSNLGITTATLYLSYSSAISSSATTASTADEATTTEEGSTPTNSFGGIVTRVTKCTNPSDNNLYEVVVDSCGGTVTATIDSAYVGERNSASSLTGQIKVIVGNQEPPAVGDTILGAAVPDLGLVCTELEGEISPSTAEYVGTISGAYGHEPDTTGACSSNNNNNSGSNSGDGGGSSWWMDILCIGGGWLCP